MFRVTLRCRRTGGEFDVWSSSREAVGPMSEALDADVVAVRDSSEAALVLAQLEWALGVRPQLREPGAE